LLILDVDIDLYCPSAQGELKQGCFDAELLYPMLQVIQNITKRSWVFSFRIGTPREIHSRADRDCGKNLLAWVAMTAAFARAYELSPSQPIRLFSTYNLGHQAYRLDRGHPGNQGN
jgi:hypothetical protein